MPRKKKAKKEPEVESSRLEVLKQEVVPIDSIKPNEYNPNRQSDHEFELLKSSMRSDGFTTPVVALKDGTIVDGFHRWKAAKELGLTEVPVVRIDMSAAQARVSTLRHNRARGEEDIELATAILRDLDQMGMLDHAQTELMLDDTDLARLIEDVAEPDPDIYGGPAATTPEEVEKRREEEWQRREDRAKARATANKAEYAKMLRLDLVFADEEAELVRKHLGGKPAADVVDILRSYKETAA